MADIKCTCRYVSFNRSDDGVVVRIPLDMDVCVRLFCVCAVRGACVGACARVCVAALPLADLPTVFGNTKLKRAAGAQYRVVEPSMTE
jgi:hypothetical protein